MNLVPGLLVLAGLCVAWGVVSGVMLTRWLDQRGLKTPFPFMRLFLFRNLGRYRDITRTETGKVGPLFYSYVIPFNVALVLVVIALAIGIIAK